MYSRHVLRCLNNLFSTKLKTVVSSVRCLKRNYNAKHESSFDMKSHLKNDVIVFRYEHPGFFIAINICSAIQCAFTTYFAVFLFRSSDLSLIKLEGHQFWSKVLEKEHEHGKVLSALCFCFGWLVLLATSFYSTRNIRKIILHKDGKLVTLLTYNLPGFNTLKLPLNSVSSQQHRTKTKSYITVKVKDKPFFYLIDIKGEFSNPTLFDFTVGIKRGF